MVDLQHGELKSRIYTGDQTTVDAEIPLLAQLRADGCICPSLEKVER